MARNDGYSTKTPSPASARDGGEWPDRVRVRDRGLENDTDDDLPPPRRRSPVNDDEDDFDPRLMDLDAEEESPFLRAQKRVPVRRGPLPRKAANRLKMTAIALACLGVLGMAGYALYDYGAHSWRFRVESSDDIQIAGVQNVSRAQVMEVFGADLGRNIFFVPLSERKRQLEKVPWVESATVMRLLPHRISVRVRERTPVAFAQVGSRIQLIDAGGVLMDAPARSAKKYSFPVLVGMAESEPVSTRAARMNIFMRLLREIDSEGARLSQEISEVNLSDPDDVKVTVSDDAGAVLVHLGSSDFLERLKLYKAHAQEWRQKFQKLESVDLRYERQVIVNPDTAAASHALPMPEAAGAGAAVDAAKPTAAAGKHTAARNTRQPAQKNPQD